MFFIALMALVLFSFVAKYLAEQKRHYPYVDQTRSLEPEKMTGVEGGDRVPVSDIVGGDVGRGRVSDAIVAKPLGESRKEQLA